MIIEFSEIEFTGLTSIHPATFYGLGHVGAHTVTSESISVSMSRSKLFFLVLSFSLPCSGFGLIMQAQPEWD